MKKLIICIGLFVTIFTIAACEQAKDQIFEFKDTEITLNVGQTYEFYDDEFKELDLVFIIADETIISIESNKVTALKTGTTTVKVSMNDVIQEPILTVNVVEQQTILPVESINIIGPSEGIVGQEILLVAEVLPLNATNQTVTWSTSDQTLASVNDGLVKLFKVGIVTITATADNVSKTFDIKINEVIEEKVLILEVLDEGMVNDKLTLTVKLNDEVLDISKVVITLSDNTLATISGNQLTLTKKGTLTVTVTFDDLSTTKEIVIDEVIEERVLSIILDEVMVVGGILQLNPKLNGENINHSDVSYTLSQSGVLVIENGFLRAINQGNVTITLTYDNLSIEKDIEVKANQTSHPWSILTILAYHSGYEGDTLTLDIYLNSTKLNINDVSLSVTNTEIAQIQNGVVTLINEGLFDIIAIYDGLITTHQVVVYPVDETVYLDLIIPTEVYVSNSFLFTTKYKNNIVPLDNLTVTFSDEEMINLSNGFITFVKSGVLEITIRYLNNTLIKEVIVLEEEVVEPIYEFTIKGPSWVYVSDSFYYYTKGLPDTVDLDDIVWEVSDSVFADVNGTYVNFKAKGEVTLIAHYKQSSAQLVIRIDEEEVPSRIIGPTQVLVGEKISYILFNDDKTIDQSEIEWGTYDESIGYFMDGKLVLINSGTLYIYAIYGVNYEYSEIEVEVLGELSIDGQTDAIVGETFDIKIMLFDEVLSVSDLTIELSNSLIAEINDLTLTFKQKGTLNINVYYYDLEVSLTIEVSETLSNEFYVEAPIFVVVNQVLPLTAMLGLDEIDADKVTYRSLNVQYATFNGNKVTFYKQGEVTIEAIYRGVIYTHYFIILEYMESPLHISGNDIGYIGEIINLSVLGLSQPVNYNQIYWESSNTELATVVNGNVSLLKAGVVTITVTYKGDSATFEILIFDEEISKMKFMIPSVATIGNEINLFVLFEYRPLDLVNVEVSMSNPSIATYENGKINVIGIGTVLVEVTYEGITYFHEIRINNGAPTIDITNIELISIDSEVRLTVNGIPNGVSLNDLVWTSSNEAVAFVRDGLVVGLSEGVTTLTVNYYQMTASIDIEVTKKPVFAYTSETEIGDFNFNFMINDTVIDKEELTIISSNTQIATVNSSNEIEVVGVGDFKLTVIYKGIEITSNTIHAKAKREVIEGIFKGFGGEVFSFETLKTYAGVSTDVIISLLPGQTIVSIDQVKNEIKFLTEGMQQVKLSTSTVDYIITLMSIDETLKINIMLDNENFIDESVMLTYTSNVDVDRSFNEISWTSSNPSVATIEDGVITFINHGTVTVTLTLNGQTFEKEVTSKLDAKIEVNLPKNAYNGDSLIISVKVNGQLTTLPDTVWSSSNPNVVKIEEGKLKYISAGSTVITFEYMGIVIRFPMTINEPLNINVNVNSKIYLLDKTTFELTATNGNIDITKLVIKTNENISLVNGVVTGLKEGIGEITITYGDLVKLVEIEVLNQQDAKFFDVQLPTTINLEQPVDFGFVLDDVNIDESKVEIIISDPTSGLIYDGKLYIIKPNDFDITFKYYDFDYVFNYRYFDYYRFGYKKLEYVGQSYIFRGEKIELLYELDGVSIPVSQLNFSLFSIMYDDLKINGNYLESVFLNPSYFWYRTTTGLVTLNPMTSDFYTYGRSATIYVLDRPGDNQITIMGHSIILKTIPRLLQVFDKNGMIEDYENITWSSSNPEVAYVNEGGIVLAIGEGSSYITATYNGISTSFYVETIGSLNIPNLPDRVFEL